MHGVEVTIAAKSIKNQLDSTATLEERCRQAFRVAITEDGGPFWMCANLDLDTKFRSAVVAVLLGATKEEKGKITHALKPLQALSAILRGVPVDLENVDIENALPLMKWYHEEDDKIKRKAVGQ